MKKRTLPRRVVHSAGAKASSEIAKAVSHSRAPNVGHSTLPAPALRSQSETVFIVTGGLGAMRPACLLDPRPLITSISRRASRGRLSFTLVRWPRLVAVRGHVGMVFQTAPASECASPYAQRESRVLTSLGHSLGLDTGLEGQSQALLSSCVLSGSDGDFADFL